MNLREGAQAQTNNPSTRRDFLKTCGLSLAGLAAASVCAAEEKSTTPRFITQWGKRGKAEGEFDIAIGLAINRHDELFTTEFRNNRVQKFDKNGKLLAVFPTHEMPGGIAVDYDGNIYVSHLMSGIITVMDKKGKIIRDWGKSGTADGDLQQPGGIAIARDGNLYIADQVNRRVQKFTPEGKLLLKWGEYGVGIGQFGGNENRANRTGGPNFLAIDRHGDIYTTEASVGRIQKFTPEGKYILSWGDNTGGPGGFGGRPKNLPGPIGVCVDKQERIWVSATNHRVQQFTKEGKFLRGFGTKGSEPGQFITPHCMVVDSHGDLYVCDTQNARIQKFDIRT
jgi:DNA-binding beta-propeller fold protein YncE